jgi:hypothetical protein
MCMPIATEPATTPRQDAAMNAAAVRRTRDPTAATATTNAQTAVAAAWPGDQVCTTAAVIHVVAAGTASRASTLVKR